MPFGVNLIAEHIFVAKWPHAYDTLLSSALHLKPPHTELACKFVVPLAGTQGPYTAFKPNTQAIVTGLAYCFASY